MNKRRRYQAKRRRLVEYWRSRYNYPWRHSHGGMYAVRYEAKKTLMRMGAWEL